MSSAFMVVIHRLNTGGYDHIGIAIMTGILLGLFASFFDNSRRRRTGR
jgi:hypothetical protein